MIVERVLTALMDRFDTVERGSFHSRLQPLSSLLLDVAIGLLRAHPSRREARLHENANRRRRPPHERKFASGVDKPVAPLAKRRCVT